MSALGDEDQRQMGREFGARWREAILKQSKFTKSKPQVFYQR